MLCLDRRLTDISQSPLYEFSAPKARNERFPLDETTVTTSVVAKVIPKVKAIVSLPAIGVPKATYIAVVSVAPALRTARLKVAAVEDWLQIVIVDITAESVPEPGTV